MIQIHGYVQPWTYLERLIQLGGHAYSSTIVTDSRPLGSGEVMSEGGLMIGFDGLDHEVLGFAA